MKQLLAALALLLLLPLALCAAEEGDSATPMTPQAALERLLKADTVKADWFAEVFLNAVPLPQLQALLAQLRTGLGPIEKVEAAADGEYVSVFQRGAVPTKIHLDASGRIDALFFSSPQSRSSSLDELMAAFKALPGKVSVLVLEGDAVRAQVNADEPLAVGSAFKLTVLQTLKQQVDAGKAAWNQVLPLREEWKSLPSGILQDWPAGSPMTLNSLAALMISQSDNTATDHLIHFATLPQIEANSPRNVPFLTTRQAFQLKAKANTAFLEEYRATTAEKRRQLLAENGTKLPLPAAEEFAGAPVAADIEWFYTARELCATMNQVRDLPLMSINPGTAKAADWKRVAFKGGSEPGVLCMVTWLEAKDGRQFTVAATWNDDKALQEMEFYSLYTGLLENLKPASR